MVQITSKILGLAIATILTAYILALTMSNQAFAGTTQTGVGGGLLGLPNPNVTGGTLTINLNPGQIGATITPDQKMVIEQQIQQTTNAAISSDTFEVMFDFGFLGGNSGQVGGPVANQQQALGQVLSGMGDFISVATLGQSGGGGGGAFANGIFSTNSLGSGTILGQSGGGGGANGFLGTGNGLLGDQSHAEGNTNFATTLGGDKAISGNDNLGNCSNNSCIPLNNHNEFVGAKLGTTPNSTCVPGSIYYPSCLALNPVAPFTPANLGTGISGNDNSENLGGSDLQTTIGGDVGGALGQSQAGSSAFSGGEFNGFGGAR